MAKFLDIDKMIDTGLGLNSIGIGQLRSIEWGKKFLWDIKFVDPQDHISGPNPARGLGKKFQDFFPASDVRENIGTMTSYEWQIYMSTFKTPRQTSLFDLDVTFFDDATDTLLNWIDDWINITILNGGQFLTPLEECVRLLQVRKLNGRRETISENSYWVFPEGPISYLGSSSSDPKQYFLKFIIAGTASKSGAQESNTVETLIRSFGRQIISGGLGRLF